MKHYSTQKFYQFTFRLLFLIVAAFILFGTQSLLAQKEISLEETIAIAIQHNRKLKVDSIAIGIAQQNTIFEKSTLLPRVEINTQTNHYFQQPAAFNTIAGSNLVGYSRPSGKDQSNADLLMEMPILNLPEYKRHEINLLEEKQSQLKYNASKIDLRTEVEQVYLRVVILEKKIQLQNKSLTRNRKILEDARFLFSKGKISEADTLSAFASYYRIEPDILKLQNTLTSGKSRLNLLMGAHLKQDIILTDTLRYTNTELPIIPDAEQIYNDAAINKPGIKILQFNEDMTAKNVEMAKRYAFPTIKAVGQYTIQTQANSLEYDKSLYPNTSYIGIKMNIPIMLGNAIKSKVQTAKYENTQATLRIQVAKKLLASDIADVIALITESSTSVKKQLMVVEAATKSYQITEKQYRNGTSTRIELNITEDALRTAESDLITATYSFYLAQIELERLQATDVTI
ncbi:TolC family protein [Flavobacterium sp.]|uniref:TolC family protein n=1 Tax=Flavobacterium sp. TaxID=239 RepID=UPI003D0ADA0E